MGISIEFSEETAAYVLFGACVVCAGFLFFLPRAVAPVELPSLTLPGAQVRAALQKDDRLARKAPNTERTRQLEAMMQEQGRIERVGTEATQTYDARRTALVREYKALVEQMGEEAAMGLRARAMERLEQALDMRMPKADAEAVLGAMHNMMDRNSVSRDGYLAGPRFVVRCIYKARWNLLHGLPMAYHFEPVERLAYFGWQALHIGRVQIAARADALDQYQRAGGDRFEEAWGVLAFRIGEFDQAADSLALAERKDASLRVRNYARGARAAAAGAKRAP